jgi:uncharacterized membrane protein YgcG
MFMPPAETAAVQQDVQQKARWHHGVLTGRDLAELLLLPGMLLRPAPLEQGADTAVMSSNDSQGGRGGSQGSNACKSHSSNSSSSSSGGGGSSVQSSLAASNTPTAVVCLSEGMCQVCT